MGLFDDGQTRAFKAQLKALDARSYHVTVQTPDDGVQTAVLSAADLPRQERWLRGQNEAGAQVRLRPAARTAERVLAQPQRPVAPGVRGEGAER